MGLFDKLFGKKKKAVYTPTVTPSAPAPATASSTVDADRAEDAKIAAEFAVKKLTVPKLPSSAEEEIALKKTTQENEVNNDTASQGLACEEIGEGECKITGIGTCNDAELVIPTEINGLKVTVIGKDAFNKCEQITSAVIPYGVKCLEDHAFYRCPKLVSVKLPATLEIIGEYALSFLPIKKIVIPNTVKVIDKHALYSCEQLEEAILPESMERIGEYAFEACYSLKAIAVPKGFRELSSYAFKCCKALKDVALPEGLATISFDAFEHCAIESIVIPETVKWMKSAFRDCFNLAEVEMPPRMYTLDGTFQSCVKLKEIVIPEGLTEIGSYTYYGLEYPKHVDIPEGVKKLGESAFAGMCYIETASLPSTIESIGDECFANSGIERIYYNGTKEQFDAITLGEDWCSGSNIEVKCKDTSFKA